MGRFDLTSERITSDSIPRVITLLSIPLLGQNIVHILQQTIDLFWVGRYSGEAVAAIGLASPVLWLLANVMATSGVVGTQILVSQYVGVNDVYNARKAAFTGLVVTLVFSLFFAFFSYIGAGWITKLMTTVQSQPQPEVSRLAAAYLRVLSLGYIVAAIGDVIEAAYIGWGDSETSLYLNTTSVLVNIILDPILIFGVGPIPQMGIRGAALATTFGFIASLALSMVFILYNRAGGILSKPALKLDKGEIYTLLDIGVPRAVQGLAGTSAAMMMVVLVSTTGGSAGLAAYTIGSRVESLASRAIKSLKQASQTIIGQNIGAGNTTRAANTTYIGSMLAVVLLSVSGVAQWISAEPLIHMLAPEVSGLGLIYAVDYLHILAVGYPIMGVVSLFKAGFDGARQTKTTMVISLIRTWGIQIPLAIATGVLLRYGIIGVFSSRVISGLLIAIVLVAYYYYSIQNMMYEDAKKLIDEPSQN